LKKFRKHWKNIK